MNSYTFTVITPCRNAASLIEETISSILNQTAIKSGRATLQYIVVDGNSTDDTAKKVLEVTGGKAEIISEPDSGMYDALSKGLKLAQGRWVSYLNAGDLYLPTAFDTVLDVELDVPDVKWLTGQNTFFNVNGQIINSHLPFAYRQKFLKKGLYGSMLPFVQQESTFWKLELLRTVDFETLRKYRLAGDHYLWSCFSRESSLKIVSSILGGFKIHPGQLSESKDKYILEIKNHSSGSYNLWQWLNVLIDKFLWTQHPRIKRYFNPKGIITYDTRKQKWI